MNAPTTTAASLPRRLIKPALTVAVIGLMLVGIDRLVGSFDKDEVATGFSAMPADAIGLALLLLLIQQGLGVVQETMAARFAGLHTLRTGRIAVASLISRSLSTLGLATITGFALRMRIYGAWEVPRDDVVRLSLFNESSYLIGILASMAAVFTVAGIPDVATAAVSLPSPQLLGGIAGAMLLAYVMISLRRTAPLRIRSFELPMVRGELLVAQITLPVLSLILGSAIVWVCLPEGAGLSLGDTVSACFLAGIAGSISQVPGGLGVFETVVLQFAAPASHPAVLAALLVRRVIVTLVPIGAGTLTLAAFELSRRPQRRAPVWSGMLASALSVTVFAAGVVLIVTASVGTLHGPFARLGALAHTLVFAIGFGTLFVSRGLHLGDPRAWRAAVVLLAIRVTIALFSGPDVPALLIALFVGTLLVMTHSTCRARHQHDEDATAWYVALVVAMLGVGWVALTADPSAMTRAVSVRAAGIAIAAAALLAAAIVRRVRR